MKRGLWLAAAAGALCACATGRVTPGMHKGGYGVELAAPSLEQARRNAVSSLFDLYVSSPSEVQSVLDEKILKNPSAFIVREKASDESGQVHLSALVDYDKLGRALDAAGLVKPAGVEGKPRVLVALRETGPGGGAAADTLRRRLSERGFTVVADTDTRGAQILVDGTASGRPEADPRLAGYDSCRADVEADALQLPGRTSAAKVSEEASSVDLNEAAACAKALESSGEIAADKLTTALGSVYRERAQFTVVVRNLGNLDRARQLLQAMRGLPKVAAAAFDASEDSDVRVKVWSEKMGADDMTAELMKLKDFKLEVRDVDPSFNEIEFGTGEVY